MLHFTSIVETTLWEAFKYNNWGWGTQTSHLLDVGWEVLPIIAELSLLWFKKLEMHRCVLIAKENCF